MFAQEKANKHNFSSLRQVKNINFFIRRNIQAEVAERLCSRLQSDPMGFDSLPRLLLLEVFE